MNFYFKTTKSRVWGKGSFWVFVITDVKFCAGTGPSQFPLPSVGPFASSTLCMPRKVGVGAGASPAFSRRKACSADSCSSGSFVGGQDDKEDSVEEIRKSKKSRKRRKVLVMCDGENSCKRQEGAGASLQTALPCSCASHQLFQTVLKPCSPQVSPQEFQQCCPHCC